MLEINNQDFTGQTLIERTDLDDAIFIHCCFSQETPDTHIFPETITGANFAYCNLDNAFVPTGNGVGESSQRKFAAQPDGHDWLLDDAGTPTEMVNPPIIAVIE